MTADQTLRRRLAAHAGQGNWGLFLGLGSALALAGAALFALALTGGHAARAWHLFHVNWIYFTSLAGGSVALVAVYKVANAKWSGVLVRFASTAIAFMPLALLGFVLVFTVGYEHIYGPMQEELPGLASGKAAWLSRPWMAARLGLGLLALTWVGWAMIRRDLAPDAWEAAQSADGRRGAFERLARGFDGSPAALAATNAAVARLAAIFVPLYAMVLTLIAFDGIMALQPHWFSNLLGGWVFMGAFLGGNALLAILHLHGGRETGVGHLISPKQRHDLGKMIFGFSVFWTYLMWSQFLVIWYGNLPEETGFVFARLWGPWRPVAVAVLAGMFIVPFVGLLGVLPKKWPPTLGLFSGVLLVALWLERYLMVMPSVTVEAGPVFGLPELGPTLLFLGLFLLSYGLAARRWPMVSARLGEITLERESHHVEEPSEFLHEEADADFVSEAAIEEEKRH
ncbi:MAG TPA: hypothetical protein VJ773_08205 [Gemmatimonadales bacterium]|nr:hypothetical protein [Gemmatimonadales bacterium]